jgi:cytochrome c oxidase subunit 1
MQTGLLGMRRRIGDYDPTLGIETSQLLVTIAAFAIAIAVLVAFINLIYSAVKGPVAAANPWRSRSPEFQLPSPVPVHNFDEPFEVIGEPYDYGLEGSAYVSIDKERAPKAAPPPEDAAVAPAGAD